MRKIILNVAVSLDGFIEDANGAYDWCFADQDYGMKDFMNRIDSIFFGRKSYELVLKTGLEYYAGYRHYVFSKTWGNSDADKLTLINSDLSTSVAKIKQEAGKDIWLFGGASLVTGFINAGLVDELMLSVHPILLGSGKPLFQNLTSRIELALTDTKTYDTGLVQLYYEIVK